MSEAKEFTVYRDNWMRGTGEARLTEAFASLGITVHFVDGREPK